MRVAIAAVVALALLTQPGSASASAMWPVDDHCRTTAGGEHFYLGGSLAGWHVHSGSGTGGCHLYNFTTATALPVSWAHYLLPISPFYSGNYTVKARINCDHNAPNYKFYVFAEGSAQGVTSIHTTPTHLPCGSSTIQVIPELWYCAPCGASIRLVDNVPYAAEPQNADLVVFLPSD